MRLWSIHPSQLDARGLVAVWREGLLAQKVLAGKTRGYTRHPQLARFHAHKNPMAAIGTYLAEIQKEADRRGYAFDARKIRGERTRTKIGLTRGQLDFEWTHLGKKMKSRDPKAHEKWKIHPAKPHPLFRLKAGRVEAWEKI